MKKIKVRNIIIYLIIGILLFQDTIEKITELKIITYIDEISIAILFVISIFNIIRYKSITKFSIKLILGICIFSIIGILSCYLNSTFDIGKVILSNFLAIKFLILIFAVTNINVSDSIKQTVLNSITFYGKVILVFAIFNMLFPDIYTHMGIGFISYRFKMISICSLFDHPGKYGWFMLFVAIYYYICYKETKEKKNIIWAIIFALFAMLSLRTKVIVGICILIIYEMIVKIKNKQIDWKKILIVSLLILILLMIFKDILINTYKLYFTTQNGTSARMALNQNGINILKDYFPLGVGFGKYGSWYARRYYSEYYYKYNMTKVYGLEPQDAKYGTDVFWPSIIGETGAIGFLTYVYILYSIYSTLLKSYYKSKNINIKILTNFAILALIQTLCESMGEASFNSAPQNILLGIVIGLALQEEAKRWKR